MEDSLERRIYYANLVEEEEDNDSGDDDYDYEKTQILINLKKIIPLLFRLIGAAIGKKAMKFIFE
jgi:hypothetical protein